MTIAPARQVPTTTSPRADQHAADRHFNRALGVECTHCHVEGEWRRPGGPKFEVARKMIAMVTELNRGPFTGATGVTCWTCHAGQLRPARLPTARWEAEQAKYFVGALATVDESTKLTMSVYNASLGVACEHCHTAGQWKADTQPAFKIVRQMNTIIETLPRFLPASARTQCFMCHKGSTAPAIR